MFGPLANPTCRSLFADPIAGRMSAAAGLDAIFLVRAGLGAMVLWPVDDATEIDHAHVGLPGASRNAAGGFRHRHVSIIGEHHRHWTR